MLFKDIVGQSYLKRRLIESAKNGRVPHAQLFAGIEGSGNLALALAYAQYLNCGNPSDNDSCGVCPSCLKFKALAHPDLHFVFPIVRKDKEDCDAYLSQFRNAVTKNPYITNTEWVKTISNESKTAKIYDSESAKIIKDLSYKSYEGGYKYVVIWQPEKMETGTANKLLKVIEEPSEKSVILLISNEPDRIIGTILSRTQRIAVPPVSTQDMIDYVEKKMPSAEDEYIRYVAKSAAGSVVSANSIISSDLDNNVFFDDFATLMRLAWATSGLPNKDKKCEALINLRKFAEAKSKMSRNEQLEFIRYMQRMIRENFIYNFHNKELNYESPQENQFSTKFAPFINEKNVIPISQALSDAEMHLIQNGQSKIIFSNLGIKLIMLLKNKNK